MQASFKLDPVKSVNNADESASKSGQSTDKADPSAPKADQSTDSDHSDGRIHENQETGKSQSYFSSLLQNIKKRIY